MSNQPPVRSGYRATSRMVDPLSSAAVGGILGAVMGGTRAPKGRLLPYILGGGASGTMIGGLMGTGRNIGSVTGDTLVDATGMTPNSTGALLTQIGLPLAGTAGGAYLGLKAHQRIGEELEHGDENAAQTKKKEKKAMSLIEFGAKIAQSTCTPCDMPNGPTNKKHMTGASPAVLDASQQSEEIGKPPVTETEHSEAKAKQPEEGVKAARFKQANPFAAAGKALAPMVGKILPKFMGAAPAAAQAASKIRITPADVARVGQTGAQAASKIRITPQDVARVGQTGAQAAGKVTITPADLAARFGSGRQLATRPAVPVAPPRAGGPAPAAPSGAATTTAGSRLTPQQLAEMRHLNANGIGYTLPKNGPSPAVPPWARAQQLRDAGLDPKTGLRPGTQTPAAPAPLPPPSAAGAGAPNFSKHTPTLWNGATGELRSKILADKGFPGMHKTDFSKLAPELQAMANSYFTKGGSARGFGEKIAAGLSDWMPSAAAWAGKKEQPMLSDPLTGLAADSAGSIDVDRAMRLPAKTTKEERWPGPSPALENVTAGLEYADYPRKKMFEGWGKLLGHAGVAANAPRHWKAVNTPQARTTVDDTYATPAAAVSVGGTAKATPTPKRFGGIMFDTVMKAIKDKQDAARSGAPRPDKSNQKTEPSRSSLTTNPDPFGDKPVANSNLNKYLIGGGLGLGALGLGGLLYHHMNSPKKKKKDEGED